MSSTSSASQSPSSTLSTSVTSTAASPSPLQPSRDDLGAFPTAVSSTSTSSAASATASGKADSSVSGFGGYYFILIAVLLSIAGLSGFLLWRKRRRAMNTWDQSLPLRRHQHSAWRRSTESRVEGLNEHGEAPPPYIPKPHEDHPQTNESTGASDRADGPTIPLQTLSRDMAGLKPPEYADVQAQESGRSDSEVREPPRPRNE